MIALILALAAPFASYAAPIEGKAASVHALGLGKHIALRGPTSRFHAKATNGSSIPTGGAIWPTAIYWALVQIGTPPQDFPAAIDSGSGDLDVAGMGCDGCVTAPPNNQYNPDLSSTSATALPRTFSNTYETCDLTDPTASCTITGNRYSDQVSLAGIGPVEVELGSIQSQTSNFDQFKEIDGVVGFTMGGKSNVFAQLVDAGLCANVWAICFHEGSTSNGTLTVGGVDDRLASGIINYVADAGVNANGDGFHSVNVHAVVLGSNTSSAAPSAVRIPTRSASRSSVAPSDLPQAAILDTGTNILLLPDYLIASLESSMCADESLVGCSDLWMANGGSGCVSLNDEEVAAYPPLSLELDGGLMLDMTADDYLLLGSPLAEPGSGQYCLGIKVGDASYGGFIIGDTTMRHYYLVFDYTNRQIGWGDVNTGTCGSV